MRFINGMARTVMRFEIMAAGGIQYAGIIEGTR
jgi:hypothetical protein